MTPSAASMTAPYAQLANRAIRYASRGTWQSFSLLDGAMEGFGDDGNDGGDGDDEYNDDDGDDNGGDGGGLDLR